MSAAVIERKALDDALRTVKSACFAANKKMPVLAGVRLAFRGTQLTFETTDLDRSITLSVPLTERGTRGDVIVPLAALERSLKHRTGEIELNVGDNGSLRVSTDGSVATIAGLNLADWPNIIEPTGQPFTVTKAMAAGIRRVAAAASREDSRPILTGVYFHRGYIVASDSYRLAIAGPFQPVPDMLVSADPLVAAVAEGSQMAYDPDGQRLMILNGAKETIIRTIPGDFPNYHTLDIAKPASTIRFSRAGAIAALKRAEVAAGADHSIPVRLEAGRRGFQFEVVTQGQQVLCEQVAGGGDLPEVVAFNPTFLRQGCEACTGQSVEMWLTDKVKPVKLVDGFFSYLLMPVRVP